MPNDDPLTARFDRALAIGRPALLRLMAEALLELGRADPGLLPLSMAASERLDTIASAPEPSDDGEIFLDDLDRHLEDDDR